jgi:hypothetical protein
MTSPQVEMMKMKKILAVSIILLFIGVAVAPSINLSVVKASNDNDLVEVTSQACGIKGYGNTTVKLTRQQYQDLEQYLVEFRARLNQTTTKEEAVPIFKEAVVELNKYGLLPRGMSVERAQRLVTGQYQDKKLMNYKDKSLNTPISTLNVSSNYLCLMTGVTTHLTSYGFPLRSLIYFDIVIEKLTALLNSPIVLLFLDLLDSIINSLFSLGQFGGGGLGLLFWMIYDIIPLKIFSCLAFGSADDPSNGWIFSIGLNGVKCWSSAFSGNMATIEYTVRFLGHFIICVGAIGFTGLAITTLDMNTFLIGSAFHVELNPTS